MADVNATLDLDASRAFAQIDAIERRLSGIAGVSLDLDTGTAARDLDRIADEADEVEDSLRGAEGRAEGLGSAIKGALAFVGAREALQGIVALVNAASDLEESTSKASVVFEDSFGTIEEFARNSAEAVGLSEAAALEATGTFGNLFRAQGIATDTAADLSTGVVQLAADLASFNNIEVAEAVEKLRAGLIGEVEPVRTLGINFDAASVEAKAFELGLADANGEVDNGAKLQARYAIFLEQTTTAQGDFARTSDGMANASRIAQAEFANLQTEIGQYLLPVALELVKVAREEMIPALRDVGPALAEILSAGGSAVLDLFLAMLPVVEALAPALAVAADALSAIPGPIIALAAAGVGANRGLRTLNDAMGAAEGSAGSLRGKIVGRAALAGAFLVLASVAEDAGKAIGDALGTTRQDTDVDALTNDLVALRDGLDDLANLDTIDVAFSDPSFGIDGLADAIERITAPGVFDRTTDITAFLSSLGGLIGETSARGLRSSAEAVEALDEALVGIARTDGVEAASAALTALADAEGLTADELERLLDLLPGFQVEVDAYGNEVQAAHAAQEAAEGSTGPLAEGFEDVAGGAADAAAEVETFLDALDRLVGDAISQADAISSFEQTIDDLAGAVKDAAEDGFGPLTDVLDLTDPAARAVNDAFRDGVDDLLGIARAADEAGASEAELAAIIRNGVGDLRASAEAAGLTEDQIQRLIEAYNLTPEQISTEIALYGDLDAIERIERLLGYTARLDREYGIVVSPTGGPGGFTENAAEGRIYSATPGGRLIRVAEGGADEVVVPTNQPLRAAALLEQAGIVEPVPVAAGVGAGVERGPAIGSLTLVGYPDPDEAMRTVKRRVDDADFLAGGF